MKAFNSVVKAISKSCLDIINSEEFVHKIIVEKSTVPLGTASTIQKTMEEDLKHVLTKDRSFEDLFSIVSMPEFLAEGSAIRDLTHPQRVVIGTSNTGAFELLNILV